MANPKPTPLTLLQLLETHPQLSELELMERMGLDESSVRGFVQILRTLGLKVQAQLDHDTTYTLLPAQHLPPMMLRDNEVVAIVAALQHANELDVGIDGVEQALAKFTRFVHPRLNERIEEAYSHLENPELYDDEEYDEDYEYQGAGGYEATFNRAIEQQRQVRITYYSWGNDEETKRTIDPYGLAQHKKKRYVVGYCHLRQDMRVFRLDGIHAARILDKTFKLPAGFDAVAYLNDTLGKGGS